jgi:hypothetical protein
VAILSGASEALGLHPFFPPLAVLFVFDPVLVLLAVGPGGALEGLGLLLYSVSQCSWATSGLPRRGKNEKSATTPAILHKAADQPEVQYHCITL